MNTRYIITLISIFLIVYSGFGQTKTDFEKKRNKIQRNIEFTNELLTKTNKTANVSLNRLKLINKKIYNRENLLNTLNSEIRFLNASIDVKTDSIYLLEIELTELLKEYEIMILYAAKNKTTYDKMIFIFSSNNFNQAYKRTIYLQQYVVFRKKQVQLIERTREELEVQKNDLIDTKKHKQVLLNLRQRENNRLLKERQQQTLVLKGLNSKIEELKHQLEKRKKITGELDRSVSETVNEINKELAFSKKPNNRTKTLAVDDLAYDPNGFSKNKGKLTWPTEHGVVLNYFGRHQHSFLKGVKIFNNGIDISTTSGADAKAVYDGKVSKIVTIPGANIAVLLCHGEYFTLYSNLESVDVKVGDKISENEVLGKIYTDKNDNNITLLQFQVWHLDKKLNPVKWLSHN